MRCSPPFKIPAAGVHRQAKGKPADWVSNSGTIREKNEPIPKQGIHSDFVVAFLLRSDVKNTTSRSR